jgi:hypothetical protein
VSPTRLARGLGRGAADHAADGAADPAGTNADGRTFALHPFMGPLQDLFEQGRLAVLANVGTLIQPTTKAQYQAARWAPDQPVLAQRPAVHLAGALDRGRAHRLGRPLRDLWPA